MKVLSVILGVIMVLFGISCTCTPISTFLGVTYCIVFLTLFYGIFGLINGIASKNFGLPFIFSILSIVLGIVMIAFPGMIGIFVYLAAFWFLVQGVMTIYLAFVAKKSGEGAGWMLLLIFGILGAILGVIMLANPGLMTVTLGIMAGIEFAIAGFDLITIGCFA